MTYLAEVFNFKRNVNGIQMLTVTALTSTSPGGHGPQTDRLADIDHSSMAKDSISEINNQLMSTNLPNGPIVNCSIVGVKYTNGYFHNKHWQKPH